MLFGSFGVEDDIFPLIFHCEEHNLLLERWLDFLLLSQKKGDLEGAEEYYSRAILEDPRDGQMLYSYAGIVWQLHHDKDRAAAYFERAVEASPMDR